MKIYGVISDSGDGSSCVIFFKDRELVDKIMEADPERFYANEGSPAFTLNLPDNIDLKEVGITLDDEEFESYIKEETRTFTTYSDLSDFLVDSDTKKEYLFNYNGVKYKLGKREWFIREYGIDTYWQNCSFGSLWDNGLILAVKD